MDKPTVKEIEEYMAALKLPEEGFNGFSHADLPFAAYKTPLEDYDVVHKPKHYMLFDAFQISCKAKENEGIEVRDVIEKLVRKNQRSKNLDNIQASPLFDSDYVQLLQYIMRFMDKNGVEDLKKARWYLDKMIQAY